jgi:chromosome partitioning protein
MRRIAFINEKGGTCKTTLCVNLGAWMARRRGRRVLLVDLDTQGHAGKSLGVDVRSIAPTVAELLLGTAP